MSRNQIRYQEMLKEELSKIILRELEYDPGILVTISRITVTPKFDFANVFVTIFPNKKQGTILEKLNKAHKDYEYFLSDILKRGRSPRLKFEIDSSLLEGYDLNNLLDEVLEEDNAKPE